MMVTEGAEALGELAKAAQQSGGKTGRVLIIIFLSLVSVVTISKTIGVLPDFSNPIVIFDGYVQDSANSPLANYRVFIVELKESDSTDVQGRFSFEVERDRLPGRTITLEFEAPSGKKMTRKTTWHDHAGAHIQVVFR